MKFSCKQFNSHMLSYLYTKTVRDVSRMCGLEYCSKDIYTNRNGITWV